jgi:acyl carrier protein
MSIETIRAVLATHSRIRAPMAEIGNDANLFTAGMTSLASVDVILALEEAFEIEFADHMMHRKTFESVNAIAAAIESLRMKVGAA